MAYSLCFILLLCRLRSALSVSDTVNQTSNVWNNSFSEEQTFWEADANQTSGDPLGQWRWDNRRWTTQEPIGYKTHDRALIDSLPASFDPRHKWPYCYTLNNIRDQGACGSHWVLGTVAAITDRYCIASNGSKHFEASADDVLSCSRGPSNGCLGGNPEQAYVYWKYHGVVSGGDFNSGRGCKPYRVPPCPAHKIGMPCSSNSYIHTPRCMQMCIRWYNKSYADDLKFASEIYRIVGEGNMKAELYKNGPITATMDVFEDFLTHNHGVYKYKMGRKLSPHAVKLMGWGEEIGVKYWLAANAWTAEWGEEGFFKILRGVNMCGIERPAIADQGTCGSCWVFGSVAAISDRYCTVSNARRKFYASADDALACSQGGSCEGGGDAIQVYLYWKNHGIVSGGAYNSGNGCRPYRVPPCPEHRIGIPCPNTTYVSTAMPRCEQFCIRGYEKSYRNDLEFASEIYFVAGEENIKAELYLNGPVTASMQVYEDFLTYKCGVYRHKAGNHVYSHVFKLLGWGEEHGVKYWWAANSWNVEWGEGGFFKILRGDNTCEIDSIVLAGMPRL